MERFFLNFRGHKSFLWGHWYPVLDFWWCLPWVSKPGWIPRLHALSPACNEFLRFTSGATPADCIEVSMAAEPFRSTYLQMCLQALVEVWGSNLWPSVPQTRRCRPLGHSGSSLRLNGTVAYRLFTVLQGLVCTHVCCPIWERYSEKIVSKMPRSTKYMVL